MSIIIATFFHILLAWNIVSLWVHALWVFYKQGKFLLIVELYLFTEELDLFILRLIFNGKC
jgi:hypothetical protein